MFVVGFLYLQLPFFLGFGFIVAETIHGEVVFRETRIDIRNPHACVVQPATLSISR